MSEWLLYVRVKSLYFRLQNYIREYLEHIVSSSLVLYFRRKQGKSAIYQLKTAKNAILLALWSKRSFYPLQFLCCQIPHLQVLLILGNSKHRRVNPLKLLNFNLKFIFFFRRNFVWENGLIESKHYVFIDFNHMLVNVLRQYFVF